MGEKRRQEQEGRCEDRLRKQRGGNRNDVARALMGETWGS
jgi:hypothetical protein